MGIARRNMARLHQSAGPDKAWNAVRTPAAGADVEIRANLPQHEKISNALTVLVDAGTMEWDGLAEYRMALDLAVVAWDTSLLPAGEQAEALKKLFDLAPGPDDSPRREVIAFVEKLMAKKRELFPDDKRWVASCEVRLKKDRLHVTAAALSSPKGASVGGSRAA